jgi:polyferredoxin
MNLRRTARLISVLLLAVFLGLYVASKIHFFTNYNPNGTGDYLHEHSVYWILLAVTALLTWIAERYFQKR